ncbi:MAG: lactate racemase domain-containing protein [Dehalococcoidales bacterium]|jgi:nickel-dependent lactate racemase|nr:lactate racemase domain-containing protein [Dehalococcoidales bacterium]MDP7525202.1 lactate racemase domain-containing protein [Dehalococcoidales bacterium]
MSIVKLPQYIWHNQKDVEFPLPDDWQITVQNIAGHDRPALKPEEIRAAIASPVGMEPLRERARGKQEVVILFDDMTRSTRTYEIIPFLLEELAAAGITDDRIRFICAVANHMVLDRVAMVKKLGEDIVSRFLVFNHCPFLNLTDVGTTSFGTRALINSEVIKCDLKIGIGSVMPHPQYGFAGGAKLITPGVTAYDTVKAHHGETHNGWKADQREKGLPISGHVDDNPLNADAQEIARMIGFDMIIDCLANKWGETVAVFAGDLDEIYPEAVEAARAHYLATNTKDNDIVIANNFIKASEINLAMGSAAAVTPKGGDLVILASSPSGQVVHYLLDLFGKPVAGTSHGPPLAPHLDNFIIYNQYPEAEMMARHANNDKVMMTADWNKVIERLKKSNGTGAKVAVYPNADIQYFPQPAGAGGEKSEDRAALAGR